MTAEVRDVMEETEVRVETRNRYQDLLVWQKSIDLAEAVYALTSKYPADERFGLVSQMRRAAVSTASNIAEGKGRGSRKDFVQFLRIALGSVFELETQILIGRRMHFATDTAHDTVAAQAQDVARMLQALISRLLR